MGKGSRGRVSWKRERQMKVKVKERELRNGHAERQKAAGHSHDQKPGTGIRKPPLEKVVGPAKAEPEGITRKAETRTDKEILLELKRRIDELRNCYMQNERHGFERKILKMIDELSDVNSVDHKGRTALILCAWVGWPMAVFRLLELGADPTIKDNSGETAAGHAAWADHWSIENRLRELEREWHAAEKEKEDTNPWKNKTDKEKLLELSKTVKEWRKATGIERGELRDNAMIMLKALGHVNAAYRGKTALMRCAEKGFLPGVKYLIEERNADPGIKGRVGTAEDYALVVRERGYQYVDSVIRYLERLE